MANRSSSTRETERLAAQIIREIGRELRISRVSAGLTQREVAAKLGVHQVTVSRIEGGRGGGHRVPQLVRHAAIVGLRPWVRLYPAVARPLDGPQLALIGRLRARLAPGWRVTLEVPMPIAGDLRAADAMLTLGECRIVVEAITRLADVQAQLRAARLKVRDLGATRLVLLVAATHANRRMLAGEGQLLATTLPAGTKTVMRALAEGRDPGSDGLVLL